MKKIRESVVYDNPMPVLRARHGMFPYLTELPNGDILCSFVIGEAFESIDSTSYTTVSHDGGKTWSEPKKMFNSPLENVPTSDCCKVIANGDELLGIGYYFFRENPDLPLGNAETGGLLENRVYFTRSADMGESWSRPQVVDTAWGGHCEASAPITVLKNGDYVTPVTGFAAWDGHQTAENCGRLLRSVDGGKSWNNDTVCMAFDNKNITCYEQRLCQTESGAIVVIGWNEDLKTGELLCNHYTVSKDNGMTFSSPMDTGVKGQASFVCHLEGEKILALHAKRRDTDRPGVYGYIVDLSEGRWNILDEFIVWEKETPMQKDGRVASVFAFLKFGQPSAIRLKNGNMLVCFWVCEQGQYRIQSIEIEL